MEQAQSQEQPQEQGTKIKVMSLAEILDEATAPELRFTHLVYRHTALLKDHNQMAVHVAQLTDAVNAMADELMRLIDVLAGAGILELEPQPEYQGLDEGNPDGEALQVEPGPIHEVDIEKDDIPVESSGAKSTS